MNLLKTSFLRYWASRAELFCQKLELKPSQNEPSLNSDTTLVFTIFLLAWSIDFCSCESSVLHTPWPSTILPPKIVKSQLQILILCELWTLYFWFVQKSHWLQVQEFTKIQTFCTFLGNSSNPNTLASVNHAWRLAENQMTTTWNLEDRKSVCLWRDLGDFLW